MNKRLTLLVAAVALTACGNDDPSDRVVGELASDRIELTAESGEPIVEIAFSEGDAVTAGTVLLRQDDARARARLAEAEGALRQAQARLDELVRGPRREQISAARANLEGAQQDVEFRSSELNRISELHSRGLASADAMDKARAALDAANANSKLRNAQLQEMLAGTTVEELAQAEQGVAQSDARREAAAIDVDRHAITAPVDGIVDSRLFELGERPSPGQPVAILLGGEQPYARVFVPESLRVRVSPGTRASIYVDGLDGPIDGEVRWVSSEATFTPYYALTERDRGRLSYTAKIDILEVRERLPDGVPVEVEILLD